MTERRKGHVHITNILHVHVFFFCVVIQAFPLLPGSDFCFKWAQNVRKIKWNFESSFQMRGNHRKWCCAVLYILAQPLQRSARAANHRQTARQKQRAVFRTSAGDSISKQFNKIQSAGWVCPALLVCFSKQRDIPRKWVLYNEWSYPRRWRSISTRASLWSTSTFHR